MNKDAYFFSHDSNSKDDPKCVLLIEQLGLEGYGIFWVLVETLRDQPEYKYPLSLIPAIARRYNTTTQKVESVVKGYGLFKFTEDEFFFSSSLVSRMESWEAARLKKSIAGKKGNQIRWDKYKAIAEVSQCDSTAMAPQSQTIATKLKETKLKETKLKNIGKTFLSDSYEYRLAKFLFKHVKNNYEKAKEPNWQKWSAIFNLMLRVDKLELNDILAVITFCQSDEFWYKNILSPTKLRLHYVKLKMLMQKPKYVPIKSTKAKESKFSDYGGQRDYDMAKLEKDLLGRNS